MRKEIVILAVFALLLSACSGTQGLTKEQAAAVQDAHTGFKGITLNFIKNNPPDITYSGSPLDIVVEIKNEGAETAMGTLYLSGYDPRIFPIQPSYHQFNLEGRSKFNTIGGYDALTFSTGSNQVFLPQGAETFPQQFQASACYTYTTSARIPVCIDPNPNSVLESEACDYKKPIATGVSGGQGSPIAITAVREDAIPGQANFQITVTNQGGGDVVSLSSMIDCPATLGFDDVDVIQPYSVTLSGVTGDCKPLGKVRLANKQGTIFCTFKLADATTPAFQSILEVNLLYGYLTKVTKAVTVKSIS